MTANTLEERKRYINQIKASFPDPAQSQYRDFSTPAAEIHPETGFFKLKALIAIAIFTAFVFCDQNQVKIGNYTPGQILESIQENITADQLVQKLEALYQEYVKP